MNKYPRLRHHARKRKSGRVVVYYFYDMRGMGGSDIPLGTDYDEAIKRWDEIHNLKPRISGTLEEAFVGWERDVLPTYKNKGTRDIYTRNLRRLRIGFGKSTWTGVTFPSLKQYLKKRSAKTVGNREMSLLSIIWNWARGEGLTDLPWPAHGMERSGWKNKEKARRFEVTDALFDAVYEEADQILKDAMDIATATAMRITDVRTIRVPVGNMLRLTAHKTEKPVDFDITLSPVLSAIWERRKTYRAQHVMFLSTRTGRPVTYPMLRGRWEKARAEAAKKAAERGSMALSEEIKTMYLRDMRKRASDLSETLEQASELLQHSNVTITRKHYRTKVEKLRPVR